MFVIDDMFYLPFLADFEFDQAGLDLIGPKSSTCSLFFIHAAKIRKILVTSKYSGRYLLLFYSFSIMIRVDAGNRLLKKEKSGYSHKGNNHLFLYYSCSYTLILLHHFFSHASIAILHDVQALSWSCQALTINRISGDFFDIIII